MKPFFIQDPETSIKGPLLIEASAGTGKTFNIQHLFIRNLLETNPPLKTSDCLVITFTRAATRELKERLGKALSDTLYQLQNGEGPPYIRAIEDKKEAIKKIRAALFDFDLTEIRTIHGFLAEMRKRFAWQAKIPLSFQLTAPSSLSDEKVFSIRDFLRTSKVKDFLTDQEVEILVSKPGFELEVVEEMGKGSSEISLGSSHASMKRLLSALEALPPPEALLEVPKNFKGLQTREGELKDDVEEWLLSLYSGLDFLKLGSPLKGKLEEENRLKKKKGEEDGALLSLLRDKIVFEAAFLSDRKRIVKTFAEAVYPYFRERIRLKGIVGPDELLHEVSDLVDNPHFAQSVRNQFKLVMVDEFQDTDPHQWKILSRLFLDPEWRGGFYLVGDPKQAIYRFRKADLYTYFQAKEELGHDACRVLTQNFRSEPNLLENLNHLFSLSSVLKLPKKQIEHPYIRLETGLEESFLGSNLILLPTDDEETLLSWSALQAKSDLDQGVAFLVKDRNQAARVKNALLRQGLDPLAWKNPSWKEDPLIDRIKALFLALERPEDQDRIIQFLALWTFNQGPYLLDLPRGIEALFFLKDIYEKKGAPALFEELLPLSAGGASMGKALLSEAEGFLVFERVETLFTRIEEEIPSRQPLLVLDWLDRLSLGLVEEEVLEPPTGGSDRPLILTIHMSKGLEFGVVFPVGIYARARLEGEEEEAEALRQLYVALTRAKKKIYLPYGGKHTSIINHFIASSGGVERFENALMSLPRVNKIIPSDAVQENSPNPKDKPQFVRPPELHFPRLSGKLISFTSLKEKGDEHGKSLAGGGGVLFGTLLHQALASISLKAVRLARSEEDLPFPKDIASLVLKAFKTPLSFPFGSCRLEEIEDSLLMREMEFFYGEGEDFCTGFIDLLFTFEGKTYVVDWKSHLLSSYDSETLEGEMKIGDYFKQEAFYRKAVRLYLEKSRSSSEFGGSFFIFLRGFEEDGRGVVYVP